MDVSLPPALRRVHVVGAGLIGTSLALALRGRGVDVTLSDPSPTAAALAADLGAGTLVSDDAGDPDLVVVAAPPDVCGAVVTAQLAAHPAAAVTDVASVKSAVLEQVRAGGGDLTRYVGAHPMAGRERSGAIAALADLFEGRPFVVVAHDDSAPWCVELVEQLGREVGGALSRMSAAEHDAAVAAVSHVPQVTASLVAARLRELSVESVGLAGTGLRDVTRIAASDPALWTQILAGNAPAVRRVVADLVADLERVAGALAALESGGEAPGARAVLAGAIADGNAGHARIPGKHGSGPTDYAVVTVIVPDAPGMLAGLFGDIGEEGVNLEEVHIEHGLGREVGVVEVSVLPAVAEGLREVLRRRGWRVHE